MSKCPSFSITITMSKDPVFGRARSGTVLPAKPPAALAIGFLRLTIESNGVGTFIRRSDTIPHVLIPHNTSTPSPILAAEGHETHI